MPAAVQTNSFRKQRTHQLRRRRRNQERSDLGGRAGLGCALALSVLAALGGILFTLAYIQVSQDLPSLDLLPALLESPDALLLQPTRLYDRTGKQLLYTLEAPATGKREIFSVAGLVSKGESNIFPSHLISATIASADPDFRQHSGYTLSGLLPARIQAEGSLRSLQAGMREEPKPLAQQLVSDLLLENEPPSLRRAARERLLAAQVTARFGRDQVMEWYLNSADFGAIDGATGGIKSGTGSTTTGSDTAAGSPVFGAAAASRFYFDKPASRLSLGEAAFLASAASSQDPSLDPWEDPQQAARRRDLVISKMLSQGLIDAKQATDALAQPLAFRAVNQATDRPIPAFAQTAIDQLASSIPLPGLLRGGYRVITTLDADLQAQAACAAGVQLERLSSAQPPSPASPDCPAAHLLPTLTASSLSPTSPLTASVVIFNPHSGQILALAGDPRSGHAPGSLLTPFIYLTAFSKGMSPATLAWDVPSSDPTLEAQNFDGQFHGPVRLRIALANDYLPPAENLLAQFGPDTVWRAAQELGINSLVSGQTQGSLRLLGEQGEITLLEVVQAFGALANQGTLVGRAADPDATTSRLEPVVVLRVEDAFGQRVVLDPGIPDSRAVTSAGLAYLVTDVLSDETARWPSQGHPNALEVGRPAAVKVGRTFAGNDNWTVGATPQLAIGVWIGALEGGPEGALQGGSGQAQVHPGAAASLWHALTQYTHRDLEVQSWQPPPGISRLRVCSLSGLLPTRNCPETVLEIFPAGAEPAHEDTLFRSISINRETGNQATIFTPPDLVQEKVYLVAPPEAAAWAVQSGIDQPPETFDSLPAGQAPIPGVEITSPAMLSPVSGEIEILGSAAGADFDFYRVQVGSGLNPHTWLQLGEDYSSPVEDGVLATWDTTGLDGVFVVQLRVVREDQQVDTAAVLVTVDNLPPEIQIEYPAENVTISQPGDWITFRLAAASGETLEKVEFYLDGKRIATRLEPPFHIPWQAVKGRHQLLVKATDPAGNQSEASVSFSVP